MGEVLIFGCENTLLLEFFIGDRLPGVFDPQHITHLRLLLRLINLLIGRWLLLPLPLRQPLLRRHTLTSRSIIPLSSFRFDYFRSSQLLAGFLNAHA